MIKSNVTPTSKAKSIPHPQVGRTNPNPSMTPGQKNGPVSFLPSSKGVNTKVAKNLPTKI